MPGLSAAQRAWVRRTSPQGDPMTGFPVPRHRLLIGALATAFAAASVATAVSASAATGKAPTAVKVSVSSAGAGTVGAGFAGFSYEKDRVGAGMFDAGDTDLVKLFRLLGPSVLRLGG